METSLTIHAEHVAGSLNTTADFQCRYLTDSSDWTLAPPLFRMVLRTFGQFTVRSVRCIMERSVSSWKPDPRAAAVHALAQVWSSHAPYAFPPFALVGRCLQKLRREGVEFAVMIAPVWRAYHWFPVLLSMLVELPLALPIHPDLLMNCKEEPHPLTVISPWLLGQYPELPLGERSSRGGL